MNAPQPTPPQGAVALTDAPRAALPEVTTGTCTLRPAKGGATPAATRPRTATARLKDGGVDGRLRDGQGPVGMAGHRVRHGVLPAGDSTLKSDREVHETPELKRGPTGMTKPAAGRPRGPRATPELGNSGEAGPPQPERPDTPACCSSLPPPGSHAAWLRFIPDRATGTWAPGPLDGVVTPSECL